MSALERALASYKVAYRDFQIVPKRDFGSSFHLVDGMPVAWGYVVTDGVVDVTPGAGWFQTVEEAKLGIDALHDVGAPAEIRDCREWAPAWHARYRVIRDARRAAPDMLEALKGAEHILRINHFDDWADKAAAAIAKAEGR